MDWVTRKQRGEEGGGGGHRAEMARQDEKRWRWEQKRGAKAVYIQSECSLFFHKANLPKLPEPLKLWEPHDIWVEVSVNLASSDCITALMLLKKPHLLYLLPHGAAGWQEMVVITLAPCPLRSVFDYACLGSLLQQTQAVKMVSPGSTPGFVFCMLWFVFTPLPSERHRKQPQGLFKLQHLLSGSN